jgi:hypothetical protein
MPFLTAMLIEYTGKSFHKTKNRNVSIRKPFRGSVPMIYGSGRTLIVSNVVKDAKKNIFSGFLLITYMSEIHLHQSYNLF